MERLLCEDFLHHSNENVEKMGVSSMGPVS